MQRTLRAELLDTIPPQSPDALESRRDLELINWLMGNRWWMSRNLTARVTVKDRVLELGAGGGEFARWLIAHRPRSFLSGTICGLDRAPRPESWPSGWSWLQHDLVTFENYGDFDVVIANLTLHHFDADALATLGEKLRSGPRIILACEPARRKIHLWQAHLLRLCGVNRVTRHDAPVSVSAGFRGLELPRFLGLSPAEWSTSVGENWRGAYRMIAVRRAPS